MIIVLLHLIMKIIRTNFNFLQDMFRVESYHGKMELRIFAPSSQHYFLEKWGCYIGLYMAPSFRFIYRKIPQEMT